MPNALADLQADEVTTWPQLGQPQLLERLAVVIRELFGLYEQLATAELEERRARVHGYAVSQESGTTARDRDAAAAALPAAMQVNELRGRITSLESAREYGYLLVSLGA